MGLAGESTGQGYIGDRDRAICQKRLCPLHSTANHILVRTHPRAVPELAREMIWAGSGNLRECDQRKVRSEVSFYELQNLSDSRTWIRSPDGLGLIASDHTV